MAHRTTAYVLSMLVSACVAQAQVPDADLARRAERFFRAVYGCDASGIQALASPSIQLSYPIFETLYDTPVISGVAAVQEFSTRFCQRWGDASISIDRTVTEGNQVVLVWSFSAVDLRGEVGATHESWGGMSFFRLDDEGRIEEEFGEESSPGPAARMRRLPTGR